jgi:hypothetical protein
MTREVWVVFLKLYDYEQLLALSERLCRLKIRMYYMRARNEPWNIAPVCTVVLRFRLLSHSFLPCCRPCFFLCAGAVRDDSDFVSPGLGFVSVSPIVPAFPMRNNRIGSKMTEEFLVCIL